jgi:hypothetical protein
VGSLAIAFADAKYLSPEFHVWCNTVVRLHIEREREAREPLRALHSRIPDLTIEKAFHPGRVERLYVSYQDFCLVPAIVPI